jgi:hypothetical protein
MPMLMGYVDRCKRFGEDHGLLGILSATHLLNVLLVILANGKELRMRGQTLLEQFCKTLRLHLIIMIWLGNWRVNNQQSMEWYSFILWFLP